MKKDEVFLNSIFIRNRLTELGLKQWWLAERIGVDRKTVTRWLNGQVKSIQIENAKALSKLLQCSLEELTLHSLTDQLATPEDQKTAAKLLLESSAFEKLGPIDEWDILESLVKATIVPELPLRVLGELYLRLALVSWRQGKIESAEQFVQKADDIGTKLGDQSLLAGVFLAKADLFSWRGNVREATRNYRECLRLEKYLEDELRGAALSNFGSILYESGDLKEGQSLQKQAIEAWGENARATNLSVAHTHLCIIALKNGDLASAKEHAKQSKTFAEKDDYRRGMEMTKLLEAEIASTQGDFTVARQKVKEAMAGFSKIRFQEGIHFEFAGRVARLIGDFVESETTLKKGIEISKSFPIYQAALWLELALTQKAQGQSCEDSALRSIQLFEICGAEPKASEIKRLFQL